MILEFSGIDRELTLIPFPTNLAAVWIELMQCLAGTWSALAAWLAIGIPALFFACGCIYLLQRQLGWRVAASDILLFMLAAAVSTKLADQTKFLEEYMESRDAAQEAGNLPNVVERK